MEEFSNAATKSGLTVKLWRGERMALIGMDVAQPEDDFVGFAIEVKSPGTKGFTALRNRLAFSYPTGAKADVSGARQFPSLEAPFQKFRWVHFPKDPQDGAYSYRVTKLHMPTDGKLKSGKSLTLDINLSPTTYADFLDVGFTRNFASSQAYAERFGNDTSIIPTKADDGLSFKKTNTEAYEWLGFEAYDMIIDTLQSAVKGASFSLDVLAYDLNEPDIVALLEKMGNRLRIVIDDSGTHGEADSAETQAAARLAKTAGKANVKRMHFQNLQHHKVLIVRKNGKPIKVLHGSTNFSFRGLYIQANNALLFSSPEVAQLFEQAFELAFAGGNGFSADPFSKKWFLVATPGKPKVQFCFSPHSDPNLSLSPVGAAIDQASSSVFFSIAFLNQIKTGPTREAIDRLMGKGVFSYGISDKDTGLEVKKPDGSIGLVDFSYLSKNAPEPFKTEWSGGAGIHQHHKFVVTDFSLSSAKVFTGSSNLAPSGEKGNGDNLVMIEDQKVATAYAIEALRVFDHLHFRSAMQANFAKKSGTPSVMTLAKPKAISGKPENWFERFYKENSQSQRDRLLFSK